MVDLTSIKRELERVESKGNFHLQTQAVQLLLSQVRDYVEQIAEEEKAASEVYELQRLSRKQGSTEEEKREIAEARQALITAQKIARNLSMKKQALRQLRTEVDSLQREIDKVV